MKYAILGDIHANLEALQAVLEDARKEKCTHFISIGDIIGYNANPAECLAIVREMDMPVVRGNHDHFSAHDIIAASSHPFEVADRLQKAGQIGRAHV